MKLSKIFGKKEKGEPSNPGANELEMLQELERLEQAGSAAVHPKFRTLTEFLNGIPGVRVISQGDLRDDGWWIKLEIAINSPFAWNIVQELASVLNELSMSERLPTVFKPTSPPPYLNGGPSSYLSWVIECPTSEQKPGTIMKWLESRLPQPANETASWSDLEE